MRDASGRKRATGRRGKSGADHREKAKTPARPAVRPPTRSVARTSAHSPTRNPHRAVVLLSGGLDSATAAAVARSEGCELYAVTADYGQRHRREIESALMVGRSLGVREHRVVRLPVGSFGGSSLTDEGMEIPLGKTGAPVKPGIPSTYVPARNLVLLSVASSYAEAVGADSIFIGATQVDYSGYPDCRGDFLASFESTLALGTKRGREGRPMRIRAPLLDLTKEEIILLGTSLGVDYSLTWSCYAGGENPCGRCDSCRFRAEGFRKTGIRDPLVSGPKGKSSGGKKSRPKSGRKAR